jgi:2-haloacid dehalogenase
LHLFEGVVSVHDVQSFKPDPKVYKHFLKQTLSTKNETWLVSSNSFDVYGALSEGWKAVWLNRDSKGHLDPWGKQPTAEIENLRELSHLCLEAGSSEKAKDQSILYYGGLPFSLNERG